MFINSEIIVYFIMALLISAIIVLKGARKKIGRKKVGVGKVIRKFEDLEMNFLLIGMLSLLFFVKIEDSNVLISLFAIILLTVINLKSKVE